MLGNPAKLWDAQELLIRHLGIEPKAYPWLIMVESLEKLDTLGEYQEGKPCVWLS